MKSEFKPSRAVLGVAIAAMLALSGCSSTASSSSNPGAGRAESPARPVPAPGVDNKAREAATRTGEVYLMRGLMDIFSRGIDVMAVKLRRQGVYAVDTSYTEWENIARDIVARDARKDVSHPIIIVGHSLGANDAPKLANYLGERGIKVAYLASFDPTEPGRVGKNVGKVVNYYLPHENNRVFASAGFKGSIQNIDMTGKRDISHTTIEKDEILQQQVISNVMRLTRKKR